jgi:hypothetical protein
MSWILNWIMKRVTFSLFNSNTPIGKRLGGHDIPNVIDSYIILDLIISGRSAYTGYFQTT